MRNSTDRIGVALRDGGGVLRRRDHPELADAIDWQLRRGTLRVVLPGVYAGGAEADRLEVRLMALSRWDPDAILTGAAAAWVSFWPQLRVSAVSFAGRSLRPPVSGFVSVRRQIPPDWVRERGPLRFTDPALTALDLCAEHGGDGIDTALRTRATTLPRLRSALAATPGRRGNRLRARLVLDSRDEPWSAAERVLHRLLRSAGIGGWRSNRGVRANGRSYYLDVAFPAAMLAIEVDGRGSHDTPDAFERDRTRQNDLVLAGWRVLRFTWLMLVDEPDRVLAAIAAALSGTAAAGARAGGR